MWPLTWLHPARGSVASTLDALAAWAAQGGEGEHALPERNAFLRRALYESVARDHPELQLESRDVEAEAGGGRPRRQVVAMRLTEEVKAERAAAKRQERLAKVEARSGFFRVWRLLTAARKVRPPPPPPPTSPPLRPPPPTSTHLRPPLPTSAHPRPPPPTTCQLTSSRHTPRHRLRLAVRPTLQPVVGHNCTYDLMFLYSHFEGPLPASLAEFKASLHGLLPEVRAPERQGRA